MVALLGALTLVSPVAGTDLSTYQGWLTRSRMPSPRVRVELRRAPCPGNPRAFGCTGPPGRDGLPARIWLHPRAPRPRQTLLHEVGHVFDLYMSAGDRRRFKRTTRDRRPWRRARERFAEGYATCASVRRVRRTLLGRHGYVVSQHTRRRVCDFIRRRTTLTAGRP